MDLTLHCRGTRGSIPAPGPHTARYGGNTSCVEIAAGSRRLIFDAGSGVRALGAALVDGGAPVEATIFLTHFHWDHIQGLPFFPPLYDEATRLEIVGPVQYTPEGEELDVESLFAGQMGPVYFPVPISAVSAACSFGHLNEGVREEGGIRVSAMRVKHPSWAVGYRIDFAGRSVAYIPDNEVSSEAYPVGAKWRARFVDFLGDVDVLLHDAMYTDEEYRARVNWGHSTFSQAVEVADEAGVRDLFFFHHDPRRTDLHLDEIVARQREAALSAGRSVRIGAAAEGVTIVA